MKFENKDAALAWVEEIYITVATHPDASCAERIRAAVEISKLYGLGGSAREDEEETQSLATIMANSSKAVDKTPAKPVKRSSGVKAQGVLPVPSEAAAEAKAGGDPRPLGELRTLFAKANAKKP